MVESLAAMPAPAALLAVLSGIAGLDALLESGVTPPPVELLTGGLLAPAGMSLLRLQAVRAVNAVNAHATPTALRKKWADRIIMRRLLGWVNEVG